METANTTAETPDNGAETPKEESPIAAAIKALVAAILEEAGERVIESPEFEGRVEQLAEGTLESSGYLSSLIEDAIGDADISYQVEEVVENMDLSCQVENALDCMDLDSQVERSLESLDIPNCDHVSGIIRDATEGLGDRILALEEAEPVGSSPAGAETMRRAIVELKAAGEERNDLLASIHVRLGELEQSTTSQFSRLDNIQIAFRGLVETMFAK